MSNTRTFSLLATCLVAALAPTLVAAQPGDEFASNGGAGRAFANVPEDHPNCAGPVYEYWAKTDELNELFEQRKQSVNPEASELSNEINETAEERGEIADEIIECVKDDVIGARPPPLEGNVDQVAPFELRAEKDQPQEPVVLGKRTPRLDPREPGLSATPGRLPEEKVTGVLVPPARQTGNGPPPVDGGGGGGGGGGGSQVELDVSGKIVGTGGGTGPGGTVPNDFTRNYAFAQGMLLGVGDAGQETGGRLAQVMVASGYLVMGDVKKAQEQLGLIPGQSVKIADLQKDLEAFSEIINGDPEGTDLGHSLQSGRTVGKKLTEIFMGKYHLDLDVPPLQPPNGGQLLEPFNAPFRSGATQPAAR